MHEYLLDLRLVKRIWENMARRDDPEIILKRDEILSKCQLLIAKAFGEHEREPRPAITEASKLSQGDVTAPSLQVVRDVLTFVSGACSFYELVKSRYPLTEEEKNAGKALLDLLEQLREFVPQNDANEL